MDQLLIEIGKGAPAAVAVVIVVIIFVKMMREERIATTKFFKELHDEHLDERSRSREAIHENSAALQQNVVATTRNTDSLAQFTRSIEKMIEHQKH